MPNSPANGRMPCLPLRNLNLRARHRQIINVDWFQFPAKAAGSRWRAPIVNGGSPAVRRTPAGRRPCQSQPGGKSTSAGRCGRPRRRRQPQQERRKASCSHSRRAIRPMSAGLAGRPLPFATKLRASATSSGRRRSQASPAMPASFMWASISTSPRAASTVTQVARPSTAPNFGSELKPSSRSFVAPAEGPTLALCPALSHPRLSAARSSSPAPSLGPRFRLSRHLYRAHKRLAQDDRRHLQSACSRAGGEYSPAWAAPQIRTPAPRRIRGSAARRSWSIFASRMVGWSISPMT